MALLLKANGRIDAITPAHGRTFTLAELHAYVGGYIEVVRAPDTEGARAWFVCNEDGKRLQLPVNQIASLGYWQAGGVPGDPVVGDVVLCNDREIGADE